MSLIVQKYGGTSVANPESLKIVAEKIINAKKEDNQVVVVVSAMGSSTDELISLANELSEEPSPREMDMLLSAGSNELFVATGGGNLVGNERTNVLSATLNLSVGDYIEVYLRVNTSGTTSYNVGNAYNRFSGHRLIGV